MPQTWRIYDVAIAILDFDDLVAGVRVLARTRCWTAISIRLRWWASVEFHTFRHHRLEDLRFTDPSIIVVATGSQTPDLSYASGPMGEFNPRTHEHLVAVKILAQPGLFRAKIFSYD